MALDPVDRHVGLRLRARRLILGRSQQSVAQAAGFTLQQIGNYERGANRISASILYRLAQELDVAPEYFFDGLALAGGSRAVSTIEQREVGVLTRSFEAIQSRDVRRRLLRVVEAVAEAQPGRRAVAAKTRSLPPRRQP
jgi:transcriptional regulator with XRE-family HTH domain